MTCSADTYIHLPQLHRDLGGYHLTSRAGPEIDAPDRVARWSFPDPEPMRFPGALLHAEDVSFKHANAAKPVVRGVSITIERGDRVALCGPNGHGKVSRQGRCSQSSVCC